MLGTRSRRSRGRGAKLRSKLTAAPPLPMIGFDLVPLFASRISGHTVWCQLAIALIRSFAFGAPHPP